MPWWEDPRYSDIAPAGAPLSQVQKFKKDTLAPNQQKFTSDGTKVGGIEEAVVPKVAQAIEAGRNAPGLLGKLINPALNLMEGVGKYVIQPLTQGVSTALLTPQAMAAGKGNPLQSFRFAREQSKKISMGQALATTIGQAGEFLPDAITPTFMDSDFDIFDEKQRQKAFRDEWAGILASGVTDLGLALLGTKGSATAIKAGTKKVFGPGRITNQKDMDNFKNDMETIVTESVLPEGQRRTSGLRVYVDDLVNEKDTTRIINNPLVLNGTNPTRSATILSRLDNHRDVADYLLAERGDKAAYFRLFEKDAAMADHLDNYGITVINPIADFSKVGADELSPSLIKRYDKVIESKYKNDPDFAFALKEFMDIRLSGKGEFADYTPGRYAFLEQVNLKKNQLADQARFGDLKLFGADGNNGWKTKVYQSNPYDRAIRFIAWTGSRTPQGHINVTNPRIGEAAQDILSELNRLSFLRGVEGRKFKRQQLDKFVNAQNSTAKVKALAEIEIAVMTKLAEHYNVIDIQDIGSKSEAIQKITQWHMDKSSHRQSLQNFLAEGRAIPEDGSLNFVSIAGRATEGQTVPFLDFGKLERDLILHLDRNYSFAVKRPDVIRAKGVQGAVALTELFDVANMAFSNLNLIRLAYIPKNSMLDPLARASMDLGNLSLLSDGIQGTRNILYNSSLRADSLRKYVPGSPRWRERRVANRTMVEIEKYQADMKKFVDASEKAQANMLVLMKTMEKASKKNDAAKAKAANSADPKVQAAAHAADAEYTEALEAYLKAKNDYEFNDSMVIDYAKLIEKERKTKLEPFVFGEGERLAKRKRAGQEKFVVVSDSGKKYNIAGIADRQVKGSGAYAAEIDSVANFYTSSMQSLISQRLKYQGLKWVKIQRNEGEAYWNALAHRANRQIRQELDEPLGMIFRGDSKVDVMKWLFSPAGREYRRRFDDQMKSETPMWSGTKQDYDSWIDQTTQMLKDYYPSETLRRTILERDVSWQEVEAALKGNPNLLKEIDGPNISMKDFNKAEKFYTKYISSPVETGWRILGGVENRLVRTPLFQKYVQEEMRYLINAAERGGVTPSDAFITQRIRFIAQNRALERIERTLYSSRRLTNGMYAMRYAISFPMAFFNSQLVALRLMARNPMNAYWYNSIIQAMDVFEAYQDEEGNTYKSIKDVPKGTAVSVALPLTKAPKWAQDALKPYTDPRGGGIRWNPKQLEYMIADPSISWFSNVGLSTIIKNGFSLGPWKIYGEDLVKAMRGALGDDVFESSVLYGGYPAAGEGAVDTALNAIFPGYGKSFSDALRLTFGGEGSDRAMDETVAQWKTGYAEWKRNGAIGEPPTLETAAKSAAAMMFIRAFTQFGAPIATSFDPVTRSAITYYADLLEENGGDYEAAQKKMVEEWGIDSLALIGSGKKNTAGLTATMNDIKIIRNNPDLLKKIGRYGYKYIGMLSTGYDSDATVNSEYSTEIAAIYRQLKIPGAASETVTRRKNDEEIRVETESRVGWYEYQKAQEWRDAMMYQYSIGSTQEVRYESSGIKQAYDNMVKTITRQYPGFTQTYNDTREDYWNGLIPTIEKVVGDTNYRSKAFQYGTKWEEIAYWLEYAKEFKRLYDIPNQSEQSKFVLKQQFSQFHYDFLQESSEEFASFAYRWLNSIPELSEELAVG